MCSEQKEEEAGDVEGRLQEDGSRGSAERALPAQESGRGPPSGLCEDYLFSFSSVSLVLLSLRGPSELK